jgi:hypothetical protein
MDDHLILSVATDKLTEQYMIRIPEITKAAIDKLPPTLKKKMNQDILILMARAIHESKFEPRLYLSSE